MKNQDFEGTSKYVTGNLELDVLFMADHWTCKCNGKEAAHLHIASDVHCKVGVFWMIAQEISNKYHFVITVKD